MSNDLAMLKPYLPETPKRTPPLIDDISEFLGTEYEEYLGVNPDTDPHTITAKGAFSKYFEGRSKAEWIAIARSTIVTNGKTIRDLSKIVAYASLYMSSAKTISTTNYVTESQAKEWLAGFEKAYPDFAKWQKRQSQLGLARGFAIDAIGRWRFVNESNSKGADNAAGRLAVNHAVQGLCSSQIKKAAIEIVKANTPMRLIGIIHDELLIEIPARWEFKDNPYDDKGNLDLHKFVILDDIQPYIDLVIDKMTKAEEYTFKKIDPTCRIKGKADYNIAPYWWH